MDPMPGKMPSQLESRIKRKMVATTGKYFSAFSLEPKSPSMVTINFSTTISKIFCREEGTREIFREIKSDAKTKSRTTIHTVSRVLVIGIPQTSNNFSAESSI